MKAYIEDRVIEVANYVIDTQDTVRNTAKKFGISKSTVHKDLVQRLIYVKPELQGEVDKILKQHTEERHIRGGMATKRKFKS